MMLKEKSAFLAPNDRFEGFFNDVITKLSSLAGFRHQIRLSRDGLKGGMVEDERYKREGANKEALLIANDGSSGGARGGASGGASYGRDGEGFGGGGNDSGGGYGVGISGGSSYMREEEAESNNTEEEIQWSGIIGEVLREVGGSGR